MNLVHLELLLVCDKFEMFPEIQSKDILASNPLYHTLPKAFDISEETPLLQVRHQMTYIFR